MKNIKVYLLTGLTLIGFFSFKILNKNIKTFEITKAELQDKIKGGWAGQTIGVTFGGPTEFRYNGTYIQDYQTIDWHDGYLKETMENIPGLYDDIYMDLTFVEVLDRVGLDAPVDSFANAFAKAPYPLWHANQAARYNILTGLKGAEAGHWLNNPHADDIDYQIESDFAGLMNPGMPNSASTISDKVGHIMNYGDGWYGGVYVGAMYTLAFTSDDMNYVVNEALKTIPAQSEFYQCIADVIKWHKKYPSDWKQTWFEIQNKWAEDIGCPDGVFSTFNIDAKTNAAYIVLGLLYGDKNFTKTMEISTRAGQDSDCNPSSAGGILGTMIGYKNIPSYWKMGLTEIEDMDFKYTTTSLNKVYNISYNHALEMIKRNGGEISGDKITLPVQTPEPVRFEKSFDGLFPTKKVGINKPITSEITFEFEGTGFVLRGGAYKNQKDLANHLFEADCFINGKKMETATFSTDDHIRRHELFWKYELPKGKHVVTIKLKNPSANHNLRASDYIVYNDKQVVGMTVHPSH